MYTPTNRSTSLFSAPAAKALLVALSGALLAPMAAHAQCPPTFSGPTSFAAGADPRCIAAGDVNGDGMLDLLVANLSGNVAVLLATGAGQFTAAPSLSVAGQPLSIALADFNGDGKLDFCVARWSVNSVGIWLGNGAGGFSLRGNVPVVGTGPACVAAADFNGDGKMDFVVANQSSNNVTVQFGAGNGTFGASATYLVGTSPLSVAVGDFNGDGKPDLVIANSQGSDAYVLLNAGGGTFGSLTSYPTSSGSRAVVVADLNSDGLPDFAVANQFGNNVTIRLGIGGGSFGPAQSRSAGIGPCAIAVADYNSDGKPDLAVANQGDNNVSILLGTGTGTDPLFLGAPINFASGTTPFAVIAGDFNRDGKPDLAVANDGSDDAAVLLGSGVTNPVSFTTHPASQSVLAGNPVLFTAGATGGGALAYRWRRNGVNLVNGGTVSGATTATLTIYPTGAGDNGAAFDCVATNGCGSTMSNPAGLAVLPLPNCVADLGVQGGAIGHDGALDNNDFIAFIDAFFSHTGCP
jgi:hypothetical protein